MTPLSSIDLAALKQQLQEQARKLGFGALGVADVQIPADERHLISWLDAGYHGEMHYMQRHGRMRSRPEELVPGTVRVISVRMDYWPAEARAAQSVLDDPRARLCRRAMPSGVTTTRCCAACWHSLPAQAARAPGSLRLPRVRGHRAGAREARWRAMQA